jgi:threonine/homoserine/homoserine lactone efflux protein
METGAALSAVGALVVAGVGYLVLEAFGNIASDEAKEAILRRPSFATRRSRHRVLMKTGYVCAVLAFLAAVFWLAAFTSGREEDAGDARTFAVVAAVLAFVAAGLLTTWASHRCRSTERSTSRNEAIADAPATQRWAASRLTGGNRLRYPTRAAVWGPCCRNCSNYP